MSDFVLDASVILALRLPATKAQRAYAINTMELAFNGAVVAVPGLFAIEVGSALIRARRSRLVTAESVEDMILKLGKVFTETHSVDYTVANVIQLARRYMLTGYDAVYFDLAKSLGLPLASLDKGHRSACKAHGVELLTF